MDTALGNRIIALREKVAANFNSGNWEELGLLTGFADTINNHPRLLRSLSWGDEDYAGNVLTVLRQMAERDMKAFLQAEQYVRERFPEEGQYISAKPAARKITFAPHVFHLPESDVERDLVSLMMPFDAAFGGTLTAVRKACTANGLRCQRVDDIWEDSVIVQDIFSLIYRSHVVIVDFTGKNPNVMYETGIAHTLGKHVIPISQSKADVPFDLQHHRFLAYLPNGEGLNELEGALTKKLDQFKIDSWF